LAESEARAVAGGKWEIKGYKIKRLRVLSTPVGVQPLTFEDHPPGYTLPAPLQQGHHVIIEYYNMLALRKLSYFVFLE